MTVGTVVVLVGAIHSITDSLNAYPYQENEDVQKALAYATWRSEEIELPLSSG